VRFGAGNDCVACVRSLEKMRVALFITCYTDLLFPSTGKRCAPFYPFTRLSPLCCSAGTSPGIFSRGDPSFGWSHPAADHLVFRTVDIEMTKVKGVHGPRVVESKLRPAQDRHYQDGFSYVKNSSARPNTTNPTKKLITV
jgi:hypothetical protein